MMTGAFDGVCIKAKNLLDLVLILQMKNMFLMSPPKIDTTSLASDLLFIVF